jgi:hypothetical protein
VNEPCLVRELKEHIGLEIGATDEHLLLAVGLIFSFDCKNALHSRESI